MVPFDHDRLGTSFAHEDCSVLAVEVLAAQGEPQPGKQARTLHMCAQPGQRYAVRFAFSLWERRQTWQRIAVG